MSRPPPDLFLIATPIFQNPKSIFLKFFNPPNHPERHGPQNPPPPAVHHHGLAFHLPPPTSLQPATSEAPITPPAQATRAHQQGLIKMAVDATQPIQQSRTTTRSTEPPRTPRSSKPSSSGGAPPRTRFPPSTSDFSPTSNVRSANYTDYIAGSSYKGSSTASFSTRTSLSSLRDSLPEAAHIYDFTEISAATNNFLAKKYSSNTTSWRCTLRGKDVIVFQRKFRRSMETSQLREKLSAICRSHHISIIKLLGASISGSHIYLVYDFINGANLANCLRNPKNPNYTVLSTWISRMQVAADLAHGLDYIHHNTGQNIGIVHNHIKSSSIVVTEPSFNAKICHFGTAELCGDIDKTKQSKPSPTRDKGEIAEIEEEESSHSSKTTELKRSDSRSMQFEGVRGYMSPEFQSTGIATEKSDVYAFGVVILELLSGEEPFKYKFDKQSGDFRRTSVIETAREAIEGGGVGSSSGGEEWGIEGRLRRWVDRKLKDLFPVEVAERLTRVALECVHVDADKRADMRRVAVKISKLYLDSKKWSDSVRVPTGISVSLSPR